jgi:hypothetical protein
MTIGALEHWGHLTEFPPTVADLSAALDAATVALVEVQVTIFESANEIGMAVAIPVANAQNVLYAVPTMSDLRRLGETISGLAEVQVQIPVGAGKYEVGMAVPVPVAGKDGAAAPAVPNLRSRGDGDGLGLAWRGRGGASGCPIRSSSLEGSLRLGLWVLLELVGSGGVLGPARPGGGR